MLKLWKVGFAKGSFLHMDIKWRPEVAGKEWNGELYLNAKEDPETERTASCLGASNCAATGIGNVGTTAMCYVSIEHWTRRFLAYNELQL